MATPKILTGARAKLSISDPNNGQSDKVIGIFNNISYGFSYSTVPAYILGRLTAAEIDYTSVDTVSVSATGYRVIGQGGHTAGALPNVNELLSHQYVTLTVYDRLTQRRVGIIQNCRPTGYSTTISSRNTVEITINYVGIFVDDEDTSNQEIEGGDTGAVVMPAGIQAP